MDNGGLEVMEFGAIVELIGSVGFPIACAILLGVFIFKIYTDSNADNKANMEQVQARCKEREDKLYKFLEENTAINAKFAEIIARYETKLDEIKADVKEIKTDIIEMKAQQ